MSNETFVVGEIAYHQLWQCQVTILGALGRYRIVNDKGSCGVFPAYPVERSDGAISRPGTGGWGAQPRYLRKLRPPRDDLQAADPAQVPFWNLISKVPA